MCSAAATRSPMPASRACPIWPAPGPCNRGRPPTGWPGLRPATSTCSNSMTHSRSTRSCFLRISVFAPRAKAGPLSRTAASRPAGHCPSTPMAAACPRRARSFSAARQPFEPRERARRASAAILPRLRIRQEEDMAEGELVRFENDNGIGVITIDNPPVNALSPGVPEGIIAALERGNADPAIAAMVLIGAGRTFIAGADIRQFGTNRPRPVMGKRVYDVLDESQKPVVAAIHGYALGGGLE